VARVTASSLIPAAPDAFDVSQADHLTTDRLQNRYSRFGWFQPRQYWQEKTTQKSFALKWNFNDCDE
jgi:hypothetical protein